MKKETKEQIKMFQANDWDFSEETPEYVLMKRNNATASGHILIFIFLGWWTLGIANLIYHFASKKKKKIIK
ncbi:MAG: hypothetical protein ACOC44_10040 [Promethearchaeia archaeon]